MKAHVLLVEDDERLRTALTAFLREAGLTIDSVTDGDAALARINAESFDLLILSLKLPGRNVLDLCRDIRMRGIKIPIVLLMAQCSTEKKVMALKLGADAYLTEPFDPEELLARTEAPSPTYSTNRAQRAQSRFHPSEPEHRQRHSRWGFQTAPERTEFPTN